MIQIGKNTERLDWFGHPNHPNDNKIQIISSDHPNDNVPKLSF